MTGPRCAGALSQADVSAIEHATVAAVAPDRVDRWPLDAEEPQWLLPMDSGTMGRAHSAVPLTHALDAAHLAHLPGIAAHYQVHGQVPVFRLPAGAESVHRVLAREGFAPHEPTWVQVVTAGELMQATAVHGGGVARVSLSDHASPAWQAVFLGPGFDPVDGAHRVRNLSRAAGTLYVSAQIGSATVACGAASFSGGWMGVHGMRTAQSHRGQGLAGQVLQAMAQAACQRDVDRVFLQVGAANRAAQALYHRLGFATAWAYAYWRSA